MTRSNQNLLVLSIFLAACIIIFVHVFLFPLYKTEPKKSKYKLFGEYEQRMCSTNVKPVAVPFFWKYNCPKDGIVIVAQGGRLGNQMWEYASAWAVARRTGLEPYVPQCIRKVLDEVFDELTIPTLDYIAHCPVKMDNTVRSLESWTHTSQSIFLRRFSVLPELVLTWVDDIRHEFKFKKRFSETSRRVLETASKLLNNTTTIYVCIHVRRTDYKDYLWRTRKVLLAGPDYFHRAMNYFRSKYKENVAFLVVSDDPNWCRNNLVKNNNDVFVVSKGVLGSTSAGQDLAIMAACNHSIIDYGTFGVWGAILASGETILYNISQHSSVRVSELLPNWHLMN